MATENKDMQQKRGTAAAWTSDDTVLLAGEVGVETDTGRVKVGDGSTVWTSLGYLEASMDADDLPYDNATSGLAATDVQAAVDEVDGDLDTHKGAFGTDHGADHDARDHSTALGTAVWGDLSDVDMGTTAPQAGDTAYYDGSNWVPANLDVGSDGLLAQTGAGALELVGRDTYVNEHVHVNLLAPPNSSVTVGTPLVAQVSLLFFAGRQLWQSPTQNDEVTYNVQLRAGTYTLALFHEAMSDVGIYHVEFDGTEVGTIDGYAGSSAATRSTLTGLTVATTGVVAVTLKMASKNASSSGYRIRVSGMTLTRTGA